MIHDVDESLRALVRRDALNGSDVDLAFEAPTKEWASHRNKPTVDLYLYDIREDVERRQVAWESVRDNNGRVTERRRPARRFRLSYLITAWTQRAEDEHRLLSGLLSCFVRHEVIPTDLLAGGLAKQELPVYLTAALPPTEDRSISDVWSALGGELKPSLDLVVTAPLDAQQPLDVAKPPEEIDLKIHSDAKVADKQPSRDVPKLRSKVDESAIGGRAPEVARSVRVRTKR